MRSFVITAVHGRHDHLRRQRAGLAAGTRLPQEHVVVGMDDDSAAQAAEGAAERPPVRSGRAHAPHGGLPLAAARNLGAQLAGEPSPRPDDLLIFLDVDCIPSAELVAAYEDASQAHPRDILCGPVAYLPEADLDALTGGGSAFTAEPLAGLADPHPARPAPPPGESLRRDSYDLFWSLSFAVRRDMFEMLGGFDEDYTGYGAEDTDFGRTAEAAGVGLRWVGGARAFHQHHPVSDPPVEHLEDILTNGARFAAKWGQWPMRGWLEAFEERGMVRRTPDGGWTRSIRVASVPQSHVYIRNLGRPGGPDPVVRLPDPPARREDTPTGAPWWPPRMLDPEWIREAEFDLLHIHFGFDAEDPSRLEEVCAALKAKGAPLVCTVHDLVNPHHTDTALHRAQQDVLIRNSAAVITLSQRAAETVRERWGVRAHVVPHPHVVDLPLIEEYGRNPLRRDDEFRVGVHLKSLRPNMATIPLLEATVRAVAEVPGGVLQVNVHRDVWDASGPEHNPKKHSPELVEWLREHDVDVRVHNYFSDSALYSYMSSLHASLLPYRFGTHSGWMEACHDLGTPVIAPDVGCYASQGADFLYRWDGEDLDVASLREAVRQAADSHAGRADASVSGEAAGRRRRAWREEQRAEVAAAHEAIYREVLGLQDEGA